VASSYRTLYTKQVATGSNSISWKLGTANRLNPFPGASYPGDAGHILGSAGVCLDIEEHGKSTRLCFREISGVRAFFDPRSPIAERADYLIMECTYGDKPHSDPEQAFVELRDVIQHTVARRGKIIIPAFSVGRTQEIVFNLNRMISAGDLPRPGLCG
jgi:metallo-beta-lactamase family protein